MIAIGGVAVAVFMMIKNKMDMSILDEVHSSKCFKEGGIYCSFSRKDLEKKKIEELITEGYEKKVHKKISMFIKNLI